MRRKGLAALGAAAALLLSGCAGTASTVIDHSSVGVGLDVAYTGAGPASPEATTADRAVGAAPLAGFSYVDARGQIVLDPSFGRMTVLSEDPFIVRYTVADSIAWSDGVGIDGVDLMLDWAARAHPYAGVRFGSLPDPALAGSRSVSLSADRKSLDIEFAAEPARWREAFRAPLAAHQVAAGAFGSESPEAAKDAVIAAIDAAADGDVDGLARLASRWATTFDLDAAPPPASGPYAIVSSTADHVELAVNARYSGSRAPTFESIALWSLATPADAVQALAIGAVDIVQVAPVETLRTVLGRLSAERRLIGDLDAPSLLAAWFHREIDLVDPGPAPLGVLWNPWAWVPFTPSEV